MNHTKKFVKVVTALMESVVVVVVVVVVVLALSMKKIALVIRTKYQPTVRKHWLESFYTFHAIELL